MTIEPRLELLAAAPEAEEEEDDELLAPLVLNENPTTFDNTETTRSLTASDRIKPPPSESIDINND